MSMPNSIRLTRDLIDKHRGTIVNKLECRLGAEQIYAKAMIVKEYGIWFKAHIYYNPAKAANEEALLFQRIEEYEQALQGMEETSPKALWYDRYFKINRGKDGGFGFIRDTEKINKEISRLSFFLLLETDFRSTSEEILSIYRRRDVVEKSFDELKNGLDMSRLHVQSDSTAR